MKLKLFILSALFTLAACSQKKEEIMITQTSNITADNIVEELTKQVKHYPKEPIYLLSIGRSYCFVEILVNDISVYKAFNNHNSSTATEINQAIFKSGIQKVSFRLYPVGKVEGEDEIHTTFEPYSFFSLKAKYYDKNNNEDTFGSLVKEYQVPRTPNPDQNSYPDSIFIATGKDYYEGSFTFEAEVPYQLEGFEKAQDLRKINPKELEARLLKKYQEVWTIYQNKEYDNIARISYDKLKNELIAFYYTENDVKKMWDNFYPAFSNPTLEMQPIENYELKFYAEGKLVALIQNTNDPRLKGSSALWGKFEEKGKMRAFISKDYFYIPEGETEFRVY